MPQRSLIALIILFGLFSACKHDPLFNGSTDPDNNNNGNGDPSTGVPCDPDTVYFSNQILPILVSNCTQSGCHNEQDRKEGIILSSYESLMSTVEKVTSTDPDKNKLLEAIMETDPDDRMPEPPNDPLTAAQIQLIRTWIQQGARNNACNENYGGCDTTATTYSATIRPLLQQKCVGCHGGANPQGGISLTTYQSAKTLALNGRLYGAMTRTSNWMPLGGPKFDDCTLEKFRFWIDSGAPEN